MKRAAVVLVLCVLGVNTGCSRRALGRNEARVSVSGRAEAGASGKPWHEVSGGTLHRGERLRVLQGTARLQFTGGRSLELRRGSAVELGAIPSLVAGDALAVAAGSPLRVGVSGTEARVDQGAARIQHTLAVVVAAYQGGVDLNSAGRTLNVPALRQAVITAAGLIPDRAAPLAYDALDTWDRRFLGDAIDLGSDLVARSRGFTAQLAPGEGRSAGFYRQLLPALEREPDFGPARLDESHSPGETLVGAAISVEGRRGSFAERWRQIFQFRDEGAAWGLVALDQQVNRSPLLTDVDAAIGRARTPFASSAAPTPTPPAATPPPPAPAIATPPSTAPPAKPGTAPAPRAGIPPSPASPPGTVPATGPVTAPLGPPTNGLLDNTLSGLLDAVSGLLGGKR